VTSADVCVLVVAYGHADDLRACLAPLAGRYPLLVVDNSSDPECAAVAAQAGAEYVDLGRNLGFAAAVNRGMDRLDSSRDVLVLNPDAVVDAPGVARLAACLGATGNERVAAVAPRQHGGPGQAHRVAWPFPTPAGAWADALGVGRFLPRWSFLVGSVLLLRGAAIADVGPFDERFFLYAEEADWQWRAHLRGWSVRVCEEVEAYHAGAGTSADPVVRETMFHSSAEALLRKWHGRLGWTSARAATMVGALARAACRDGEERRLALCRAKLYLRGPMRAAAALGLR
jgi:GT2 family glycosyltransferase